VVRAREHEEVVVMQRKRISVVAVACAVAAACGGGTSDERAADGVTTSTGLLKESTQGVTVWAPARAGSWPVVFAIHGSTGAATDFDPMAHDLATRGVVVVAPDFREDTVSNLVNDLVCAYQGMTTIVDQFGGDIGRGITTVGFSAGADSALAAALRTDLTDPSASYADCLAKAPMPTAAVAICGCYVTMGPSPNGRLRDVVLPVAGNENVSLTLIAGDADPICPAEQTQTATTWLRDAGYQVELVIIPGGDHGNEIYRDWDHQFAAIPGDPVGQQTAQLIFDVATTANG
jgi:dienelactone hydrolase